MNGVIITISGPAHSKKGYLTAVISTMLREVGVDVTVQVTSHNKVKFEKTQQELLDAIKGTKVLIMEQKTA